MAMDRYETLKKRNIEEAEKLRQTAKDLTKKLFDFEGNPLSQNFVRRDVNVLGKSGVVFDYSKEHLTIIEPMLDAMVVKDYDFQMNPPNMRLIREQSIDQYHRDYKQARDFYNSHKRNN